MDEENVIVVPPDMLDASTLRALIEEFVTRDGTDLTDVDNNIAYVHEQLTNGEAQIVFNREEESCNIVLAAR